MLIALVRWRDFGEQLLEFEPPLVHVFLDLGRLVHASRRVLVSLVAQVEHCVVGSASSAAFLLRFVVLYLRLLLL